jgi:hypothetical protein
MQKMLFCILKTDDTFYLLLLQKMNEAESYSLMKITESAKLYHAENLEMVSKINQQQKKTINFSLCYWKYLETSTTMN